MPSIPVTPKGAAETETTPEAPSTTPKAGGNQCSSAMPTKQGGIVRREFKNPITIQIPSRVSELDLYPFKPIMRI
ncbi:hypothetical protein Ccrd_025722 [Cynara cardunculus var. scolymus]|uniref:Uncharacterized protein n=1 Tax=Cynara cardunculus var. scolymus TaxID=59895 RepID=A0A103V6L9_CYNCS|nr:hypothetical protein Ccrd_025722 [Cynara cardunculus var. scolymus]